MPNHVINEVVFTGVSDEQEALIRSLCGTSEAVVDFGVLLPVPLNAWMGSVGRNHSDAFPYTALDWCAKNWSTKWNAYGGPEFARTADSLIMRFQTAWGPPTGWLCALFNKSRIGFISHYLSEGGESAKTSTWSWGPTPFSECEWAEQVATDEMARHLHLLLWGVEEFPADQEDAE